MEIIKSMEKGCILPHDKIKDISNDMIAMDSLVKFCGFSKKEILKVLTMRNSIEKSDKKETRYGYNSYLKKGKKKREINIPNPLLKQIQNIIKDRLSFIPVSLSATAGKIGDSPIKNVLPHKDNQYLLTMDIKNAYPSIDTHRIYKNLQGALSKPIKIWFPLLEDSKSVDLFVMAITHLCTYNNMLPQGASTSSIIQNIVMSNFDNKLLSNLQNKIGENVVYTRYADDIAISFPNYQTKYVLEQKLEDLMAIIANSDFVGIEQAISNMLFIVSDKSEIRYLDENIANIRKKIFIKNNLTSDEKFKLIGIFDKYKDVISESNYNIYSLQNEIYKILSDEGWNANNRKTKIWTPHTNGNREITGLSIDSDNNIGISKTSRSKYERLFGDLIDMSPDELFLSGHYKKLFGDPGKSFGNFLDKQKIHYVVDGIFKGYLQSIYGSFRNVPKHLINLYRQVKDKYVFKNDEDRFIEIVEKVDIQPNDDMPF